MGVDENVGRNVKSRQGMIEPHYLFVPASFRPEWFGFHDDQVNIGILALVAARTDTSPVVARQVSQNPPSSARRRERGNLSRVLTFAIASSG